MKILWLVSGVAIGALSTLTYFRIKSGPEPTTSGAYYINRAPTNNGVLVFPAPASQSMYVSAKTALEIESVVVAGKVLEPEVYAPANMPSTITTKGMKSGTFAIYQQKPAMLMSWISFGADERLHYLKHFHVNPNASIIEVSYKTRYPNGRTSQLMHVKFAASDDAIGAFHVEPVSSSEMPNNSPEPALTSVTSAAGAPAAPAARAVH